VIAILRKGVTVGALTWLIWGFFLWMFMGGPSGAGAITSMLGGVGLSAVLAKLGIHVAL
jgi:hypothetical protein